MTGYLTPTEIFNKYPQLQQKLNWSKRDIGTLIRCHLLVGYHHHTKRVSMTQERSLVELIKFVNESFDETKITF